MNAMAFSKMSLLVLDVEGDGSDSSGKGKGREKGLIAVPSLVRDEMVSPDRTGQ